MLHNFDRIYAFEANPDSVTRLKQRFSDAGHLQIIWGAVTDTEEGGWATFNVSSYDGASSMGQFDPAFLKDRTDGLQMTQSVHVPTINLNKFCQEAKIQQIDAYVSDIQGADLMVLKTMAKPFLEQGWIKSIQTETAKDGKRNIYTDLPSNELSEFKKLLEPFKYKLVATGWGALKPGQFDSVPDDWWEFDSLWHYEPSVVMPVLPIVPVVPLVPVGVVPVSTNLATPTAPATTWIWTSQLGQDRWAWENVVQKKQNGYYVDVGAHDGKSYSNTYIFEHYLGWTGLCIETSAQYVCTTQSMPPQIDQSRIVRL